MLFTNTKHSILTNTTLVYTYIICTYTHAILTNTTLVYTYIICTYTYTILTNTTLVYTYTYTHSDIRLGVCKTWTLDWTGLDSDQL